MGGQWVRRRHYPTDFVWFTLCFLDEDQNRTASAGVSSLHCKTATIGRHQLTHHHGSISPPWPKGRALAWMPHPVRAWSLVCPASPARPEMAVDNGADCVYLGLRDATNARNFAGLNLMRLPLPMALPIRHARHQGLMAPQYLSAGRQSGLVAIGSRQGCRFGSECDHPGRPGLMQYASTHVSSPAAFASVGTGIGLQL